MRCGFISIIGEPNVGKSTLLNTIIGTKLAIVTPKPQTTRHRILGVKNLPDAQLVFLDTPGIHRGKTRLSRIMMQAVDAALIDPQVVLHVTDASRASYPDLAFLRRHLRQPDVAVFWLLNKTDRMEPSQLLPLIAENPDKDAFSEVIPLSALRGAAFPAGHVHGPRRAFSGRRVDSRAGDAAHPRRSTLFRGR